MAIPICAYLLLHCSNEYIQYLMHEDEPSFEGIVHIVITRVRDAATMDLFAPHTKVVVPQLVAARKAARTDNLYTVLSKLHI